MKDKSILKQQAGMASIYKGQLISKADWRAIDSPKKWTDEFVLFAFSLFTANKSNSSVRFLGKFTARQSAFWNQLTFSELVTWVLCHEM